MDETRYRILLIEDDKLDQMAFMRMVKEKELPYNCTIVSSVREARDALASKEFDIVITDYSLGDGTAFDILHLVKDTPVILVTGAGDEEIAIKAWRAGTYDYLVKDHERNYLKTVSITVENAVTHKKAEGKLRLLSAAVMSASDSVYIADMQDRIIFVNKAFCETYGYKEEEIIGKHIAILHKESPQNTGSGDIFPGIAGQECDFYHKQKDGSEFPVSLSRSVIRDENGEEIAIVGVGRDISERLFIENKVRSLNQKLKKGIRLVS